MEFALKKIIIYKHPYIIIYKYKAIKIPNIPNLHENPLQKYFSFYFILILKVEKKEIIKSF